MTLLRLKEKTGCVVTDYIYGPDGQIVAEGTSESNPARLVRIESKLSLGELQAGGHVAPGALPGSWQILSWEAFNDVARYTLELP